MTNSPAENMKSEKNIIANEENSIEVSKYDLNLFSIGDEIKGKYGE